VTTTDEIAESERTPRRPRRESIWPVLLIPLVGGLLLAVGFLAASQLDPLFDGNKSLLDGLEREVRAVTPTGTRETSLRRYDCGEGGDDSAPPNVGRHLAVATPGAERAAIDALVAGFRQRGWATNHLAADKTIPSLVSGDRVLWFTPSRNAVEVTMVESELC
jgi:hypothetical protein